MGFLAHSDKRLRTAVAVLGSMLVANAADAAMVIETTRVVFHANENSVQVKLQNVGNEPALVQLWTDDGDPSAKPDAKNPKFIVTPPLARVDPGKEQTLRVVYIGPPLPKDRETLSWFNMLEIPPKPQAGTVDSSANYLQFAVRTRIKLFQRPELLSLDVPQAMKQLQWQVRKEGDALVLQGTNPTPFYMSLVDLRPTAGDREIGKPASVTIAPFGTEMVRFEGAGAESEGVTEVRDVAIDDYGAFIKGVQNLSVKH